MPLLRYIMLLAKVSATTDLRLPLLLQFYLCLAMQQMVHVPLHPQHHKAQTVAVPYSPVCGLENTTADLCLANLVRSIDDWLMQLLYKWEVHLAINTIVPQRLLQIAYDLAYMVLFYVLLAPGNPVKALQPPNTVI